MGAMGLFICILILVPGVILYQVSFRMCVIGFSRTMTYLQPCNQSDARCQTVGCCEHLLAALADFKSVFGEGLKDIQSTVAHGRGTFWPAILA